MLKVWSRRVLADFVRTKLADYRFIVVSNREPFQHRRAGRRIECIQPASGMASALDPIMRASGGLWIAHGSGDADAQVVDARDHVRVPPHEPSYDLRRIWLTKEEQEGHYGGLSNQGLWPLCHQAFTKPVFEPSHWREYRRVNERFAQAVLEEAGNEPTFVFIQDYHFGLLPRMLRQANSNLVIAQFWHIPWPNRDVFCSFPWREELLDGMLGNDLLGFHLPHHCQNFMETVDCTLEAKIDSAGGEVARCGHTTAIRPYPIGIDFDEHVATADGPEVARAVEHWRKELGSNVPYLGIGIDRLDYTKGIPERLRSLDLLFERYPEYRGKLQFVQVAVPSRSSLAAYRAIEQEVDSLAAHINLRWRRGSWKPIHLMKRHCNEHEMIALHRMADFCLVTSLHDGMNLVAKEYVASRTDEGGALILSKFAGAARELKDAWLINPFSVEEGAAACDAALRSNADERRRRMRKMRDAVEHNNVYRWAGKLLSELAQFDFPCVEDEFANAPSPIWRGHALHVAV